MDLIEARGARMTASVQEQITRGERFAFGKNWRRFLSVLNEARIRDAQNALRQMLEVEDLRNKTFFDVGSGSGLMSLAARRLGAAVTSFDYDPQSVACARELKRRYFPNDPHWLIEEGSVLEEAYVRRKGEFDVVYSWGVLHHTGDMWRALGNVCHAVGPLGRLFIAIYNDQGAMSKYWLRVKRLYCSGVVGRSLLCAAFIPYFVLRGFAKDLLIWRHPFRRYVEPTTRGMSVFYDWFDWLGGLPFEVAKPEEVLRFLRPRGFALQQLVTVGGGLGNNQFVFVRQ